MTSSVSPGARLGGHGPGRCLSVGRALALIGGLTLVAAYFMPWFTVVSPQGSLTLTGQFLARFLAGARDLRQFVPGAAGGQDEVRLLRGLVYFFPACGGLAALVTLLGAWTPFARTALLIVLGASGLVPLVAVGVGMSRVPPGSQLNIGLWLIGAGSLAILVGLALADRFERPARQNRQGPAESRPRLNS